VERSPARQHLEQHDAKRPDVRALVDRPPLRLLGTHVRRRAEDPARHRPSVGQGRRRSQVRLKPDATYVVTCAAVASGFSRTHGLGQPEVEHLHRAVSADLDIRGLQIAMNDPLLVRRFEGVRDLFCDRQRLGEWNRAASDPL